MNVANESQTVSLDNIRPLLKEAAVIRAEIRDLEKELKEIRSQIDPVLAGKGKMQVDNYICEVKQMKGKRSLDTDALKAYLEKQGKDIDDFYKVGKPYNQFNVTEAAKTL